MVRAISRFGPIRIIVRGRRDWRVRPYQILFPEFQPERLRYCLREGINALAHLVGEIGTWYSRGDQQIRQGKLHGLASTSLRFFY
jgi:hypothetical protein